MNALARIRTLIVDDEPPARANLRALLQRDPEIEIAGECRDGEEAVRALSESSIDLVFLDVQMPELNGFDVVERIGAERMPVTVFATAFEEHAVRAFEARALDYLLKPFDDARFLRALARAKEEVRRGRQLDLTGRIQELLREHRAISEERITVRVAGRLVVVPVADIEWVEAADYCVRLHVGGATYTMRESMARMETRLGDKGFVRVHRTAIVRVDRIAEVATRGGEERVVLVDGTTVRLSRSRRKTVMQRLTEG